MRLLQAFARVLVLVASRIPGTVAMIAVATVASAAEPVHLAIGQGVSAPPAITVYLDVIDEAGVPPASLDASAIAATIGAERVQVARVQPFAATDEGVAYIFLVDVSRSVSAADMRRVRDALQRWTREAGPRDRFALIAFGDRVSTRVDFTADRASVARAIEALQPRDRTTQLHTAIERAIELGRRQDANLPARRVAILLSDGKDEGSGLTADDVAAQIREDRLPIYAIGYSRLAGDERRRGFDALRRLSRNSGGLFRGAAGADMAAIYQAMQQAVTRVFAVSLRCDTCVGDGQLHRLEIQVKSASRVLSDGIDLRLPGTPGAGSTTAAKGAGSASGAGGGKAAAGSAKDASGSASGYSSWPWIVGLLALVGAVAAITTIWLVRRRRAVAVAASAGGGVADSRGGLDGVGGVADHGAAGDGSANADADAYAGADGASGVARDVETVTCHFFGRHAPEPITVSLRDGIVIGADAECSVSIPGDASVAPHHCELMSADGRVMLRRLDGERPTLVNGAAISTNVRYLLESGDLLLIGRTELRVMFDEPATARMQGDAPVSTGAHEEDGL